MIAEDLGVTEPGAVLEFAGDLTDRGVDVDHQRRLSRSRTELPGPLEHPTDDRFKLADMTERERPEKRAERRRCHHPMTEHPSSRAGAEHVGMIDVGGAIDHCVHQRQHLATRSCPANATDQLDGGVDQSLQAETLRQGRHQQQPGVGDQVRIIEGGVDAIDRLRYSRH